MNENTKAALGALIIILWMGMLVLTIFGFLWGFLPLLDHLDIDRNIGVWSLILAVALFGKPSFSQAINQTVKS